MTMGLLHRSIVSRMKVISGASHALLHETCSGRLFANQENFLFVHESRQFEVMFLTENCNILTSLRKDVNVADYFIAPKRLWVQQSAEVPARRLRKFFRQQDY